MLVVTPWFPTHRAPGTGIFNLRDVETLAADHQVRVLHLCAPELLRPGSDFSGDREVAQGDFEVVRVPYKVGSLLSTIGAARAIRRELAGADLLHTMALPALIPTRLTRVRVPFVHTEHMSALVTRPPNALSGVVLALAKRLLRRPTEAIAVSAALAAVVDTQRRRPSTVIPNYVMTPRGVVEREDCARFERIRMIGVGGLVSRKGPLEAVGTLAELVRRGYDAELEWVGTGPLHAQVQRLAEAEGVATRLRLPGHLDPKQLSEALLAANLFLLPVESETFGVAIAEALAHGLPVVTAGTGGHEEFLPPMASRLVESRNASQLADAVSAVVGDPQLWTRDETAAYAAKLFSEESRRDAYLRVYAKATQQSSGERP